MDALLVLALILMAWLPFVPGYIAKARRVAATFKIQALAIGALAVTCLGIEIPAILLMSPASDQTVEATTMVVLPACMAMGGLMWSGALMWALNGRFTTTPRGFAVLPLEKGGEPMDRND